MEDNIKILLSSEFLSGMTLKLKIEKKKKKIEGLSIIQNKKQDFYEKPFIFIFSRLF